MPTFIIVTTVILSITAIYSLLKSTSPETASFWGFTKIPDKRLEREWAHKQLDIEVEEWTGHPDRIRHLVRYFVCESGSMEAAWTEKQLIYRLGTESYPLAIEILEDPENFEALNKIDKDIGLEGEAPINRLLEIFDNHQQSPIEIIELLQPFMKSEHEPIRTATALTICAIGTKDIIPTLQQAMKDTYRVQKYAVVGLTYAVSENRISNSDKPALFDAVAAYWSDGEFRVSDDIPSVLVYLDREKATKMLTTEDIFAINKGPVDEILEAFKKAKITIPREKILGFIEQLQRRDEWKYPDEAIMSECLHILGGYGEEADREIIEPYLKHADKLVVDGAAEGMYQIAGIGNYAHVWEKEADQGFDSLSEVEKHTYAIRTLNGEVSSGGFAQYLNNSAGNTWPHAVAGLNAAGSVDLLDTLKEVVTLFPKHCPSVDHDEREQQLSKIGRRKNNPFSDYDNRYYKSDENVDRLLLYYHLEQSKSSIRVAYDVR